MVHNMSALIMGLDFFLQSVKREMQQRKDGQELWIDFTEYVEKLEEKNLSIGTKGKFDDESKSRLDEYN